MNRKLIILDRDGVINVDSDQYIKSPDEWCAIPGSLEAIARLCRADYRVVVITNQSGINRGLFTMNTLNKIHQKMIDKITVSGGELSAVFFCPHTDEDHCSCRKPKPGMLFQAQRDFSLDLTRTVFIGDDDRCQLCSLCRFSVFYRGIYTFVRGCYLSCSLVIGNIACMVWPWKRYFIG